MGVWFKIPGKFSTYGYHRINSKLWTLALPYCVYLSNVEEASRLLEDLVEEARRRYDQRKEEGTEEGDN